MTDETQVRIVTVVRTWKVEVVGTEDDWVAHEMVPHGYFDQEEPLLAVLVYKIDEHRAIHDSTEITSVELAQVAT